MTYNKILRQSSFSVFVILSVNEESRCETLRGRMRFFAPLRMTSEGFGVTGSKVLRITGKKEKSS